MVAGELWPIKARLKFYKDSDSPDIPHFLTKNPLFPIEQATHYVTP